MNFTHIIEIMIAVHALGCVMPYYRNRTGLNKELVMQHHEKCVMLGLIALAIIWR